MYYIALDDGNIAESWYASKGDKRRLDRCKWKSEFVPHQVGDGTTGRPSLPYASAPHRIDVGE